MGHLTTKDAYRNLEDRLNWFTQGAPSSETLYKILEAFASHRAMAAVFGAILNLPPVKQAMASKQFKSIYLDRLLSRKAKK